MWLTDLLKAPMQTDLELGTAILLPTDRFSDSDMHGKTMHYVAAELAGVARFENIVDFETPNASEIMSAAIKGGHYGYTNKFLVTVGPPQPHYHGDGYWYFVPVGYAYDGRKVGFAHLVLQGERQ